MTMNKYDLFLVKNMLLFLKELFDRATLSEIDLLATDVSASHWQVTRRPKLVPIKVRR